MILFFMNKKRTKILYIKIIIRYHSLERDMKRLRTIKELDDEQNYNDLESQKGDWKIVIR